MAPLRVLVTGKPNVGKTTLVKNVAEGLSHEVRLDGKRVAFEMVTLDRKQKATLATLDQKPNTKTMGKWHVHVKSFEDLTIPLLDSVLERDAGGPEEGQGARVIFFDEIGKMELLSDEFVERVRRLLTSADENLHVLGTVALSGGGFIAESKTLPGVQVIEIDPASRSGQCTSLSGQFQRVLRGSSDETSTGHDAVDCTSLKDERLPEVRFDDGPGGFSRIYLPNPDKNFASLNAGDYYLYVGGASINRAFQEDLSAAHQNCDNYDELHQAMLMAATAQPGVLTWLGPGLVEDKAMGDCIAVAGLVPESPEMMRLSPVGLLSVAIFRENKRPQKSVRNIAMVYTVGPNCGNTRKKGRRDVDHMSVEQFRVVLREIGASLASVLKQYNQVAQAGPVPTREAQEQIAAPQVRKTDPTDGVALTWAELRSRYKGQYSERQIRQYWERDCKLVLVPTGPPVGVALPPIEVVRVCLLSGGVYKHPDASKVDVAAALVQGLVSLGGGPTMPLLDFAFDEGAFAKAWKRLGLPA